MGRESSRHLTSKGWAEARACGEGDRGGGSGRAVCGWRVGAVLRKAGGQCLEKGGGELGLQRPLPASGTVDTQTHRHPSLRTLMSPRSVPAPLECLWHLPMPALIPAQNAGPPLPGTVPGHPLPSPGEGGGDHCHPFHPHPHTRTHRSGSHRAQSLRYSNQGRNCGRGRPARPTGSSDGGDAGCGCCPPLGPGGCFQLRGHLSFKSIRS